MEKEVFLLIEKGNFQLEFELAGNIIKIYEELIN